MSEQKSITRIPNSDKNALKKGKNYLFAVGINDYVHCPKLKNAVKDVQDFITLMTTKYLFETDNIVTLLDYQANSRNIQNTLRSLAQKVTENDNLIIYFSGHGEYDKVLKQGFWIPFEAERGAFDTYLPNSTVRIALDAIPSRHTFLIADSCFSGTLFSGRDANRDISDRLERDASRWGLTAGRNEIVDDGKPGTNSPFAAKLLDILYKNEKTLGVAELCAKMMEIVAANNRQTPRGEPLQVKGHDGGQFFFHLKNEENPIEIKQNAPKTTRTKPKVEPPKVVDKTPEEDGENWKINKINVGVGALILVLGLGIWLLNSYVVQPLLSKGQEKLVSVMTDKDKQTPSLNTPQNTSVDPFEAKLVTIKGGVYHLNLKTNNNQGVGIYANDILISLNAITQKDWKNIMKNDMPKQPSFCDDCAVVGIKDKLPDFLNKLNEKTGKKYRLPTEMDLFFIKKNERFQFSKTGFHVVQSVSK